jgi:hypothetical protein
MRKEKVNFVQIISDGRSLDALDSAGNVWVYLGNEYGWGKLNMKRMTEDQVRRRREAREWK